MSHTAHSPHAVATRQAPGESVSGAFEKRSRHRPPTATDAPTKHHETEFDADPAQRSSLWIGVGLVALLGVGAWLILSGMI